MSNYILKSFCLLIFVGSLTACSSVVKNTKKIVPQRDTQYLSATNLPLLKTPSGMATIDTQTKLVIPERNDSAAAKKASLLPPGL